MPTDTSLLALRNANPRHQPGLAESITRYAALPGQITATPPAATRRRSNRAGRRRWIGLSACTALVLAVAGVFVAVTIGSGAPQSAYASAKTSLAATSRSRSGTMTLTVVSGAKTWRLETTRWHGHEVALFPGQGSVLGRDRELLLVGHGAYIETANDTWIHYARASAVGDKLGPRVQLARDNVAGTTAGRILAVTNDIQKTSRPDGTTVYTGTIPDSAADPTISAKDDTIMGVITKLRSGNQPGAPGGRHPNLRLRMIVARDGLVGRISITFHQTGAHSTTSGRATTWSIAYSQLGTTPPITPPATSAPGTRFLAPKD